jgi:ferritin-like metal-binding protein YciE
MAFFGKDIRSMDDLFVHTLRDIYYAEKQIVKSLRGLIEKASNSGLKAGLSAHLDETPRSHRAAGRSVPHAWRGGQGR